MRYWYTPMAGKPTQRWTLRNWLSGLFARREPVTQHTVNNHAGEWQPIVYPSGWNKKDR